MISLYRKIKKSVNNYYFLELNSPPLNYIGDASFVVCFRMLRSEVTDMQAVLLDIGM